MKAFLAAARKDLLRFARDPLSLLLSLLIPLAIGGLVTLAFGGSGGPAPKARLLVADEDASLLSRTLVAVLGQTGVVEVEGVERAQGAARMEAGEASALLVLPAGFGADWLAERPARLELLTNPSQRILPAIVVELLESFCEASFYAHRLLGEELRGIGAPAGGEGPAAVDVGRVAMALQARLTELGELLFPPAITLELREREQKEKRRVSMAVLYVPGIVLMALFFAAQGLSEDLWKEREAGTLARTLAAPGGVLPFFLGKLAAGGLLTGALGALVLAIGVAYHEELAWQRFPGAALWAALTGLVLLVAMLALQSLASSRRAGSILTNALLFPLLMLGGSFFPFAAMPEAMAALGRWTPNGLALAQLEALVLGRVEPRELALAGGALAAGGALLLWVTARRLCGRFLRS